MNDYKLDDTQYERAVELEDKRQAMQHDIEQEYIDDLKKIPGTKFGKLEKRGKESGKKMER